MVMTKEERKIYDPLFKQSREKFKTLLRHGVAFKNYSGVFGMLMHLRQCCDHPSFVFTERDKQSIDSHVKDFLFKKIDDTQQRDKMGNFEEKKQEEKDPFEGKEFYEEVIQRIQNEEFADCAVCFNDVNEPGLSRCCHILCYECLKKTVETKHSCPICRKPLEIEEICKIFDKLEFFSFFTF